MNPFAIWNLGRALFGGQPGKQGDDEDDQPAPQPAPKPAPPPRPAPRPQVHRPAPAAQGWGAGPNMFQEHAAMQGDMIAATNAAWAKEMSSRKAMAQAERDRQHEYELESLRQQGETERARMAQGGGQGGYQGGPPSDPDRQARNRKLMSLAGFGGHTVHSDGRGNTTVTPHPFGQSPFARSLLG